MYRTLIVLFAGSGLLSVFCMSLMQYFSFAFDYYFAHVVPGSALFGIGCGLALCSWRGKHMQSPERADRGVQWLAASALAGVSCLTALIYLPVGAIYLFLLLLVTVSLPYVAWTYGMRLLVAGNGMKISSSTTAVTAGVIAGLLASQIMLDLAGGAIRTGWLVCALLSIVVLSGARRHSLPFTVIGAVMVVGLAIHQVTATQYSLPRWQPGSGYQTKPILGALSAGKNMSSQPLQWSSGGRADLLKSSARKSGYEWLITNATAPVPLISGEQSLSWLQGRFPLLTIPLMAENTESMISISPIAGPDVAIGKHLKIPVVHSATYNEHTEKHSRKVQEILDHAAYTTSKTFVGGHYTSRERNDLYDLLFLHITHPVNSGWVGSNADEASLYTKEAIRNYWSMLNDEGIFAVTARDEMLFVRMILTLWDMLSEQQSISGKDIVKQAWGLRLLPLAPYKGSYQFLLMAMKGAPDIHQSNRIEEIAGQLPVEVVFGPGMKAARPYDLLGRSESVGIAAEKFTRIFNRRIQKRVDLRVATYQRPFFFHIIRDAHPYMKWLLTTCLGILIPVLIFPLANLRQLDVQGSSNHPPLPVILGYFCALVSTTVMAASVVMQLSREWSFSIGSGALILSVIMISGLGISGAVFSKLLDKKATLTNLAPVLMIFSLTVSYWLIGFPIEVNTDQHATFRFSVLAASCFMLGLSSGMSILLGLRHIEAVALHSLMPWIWLASGVMALAATVLVYWFSMLRGWNYVWGVASAAYLLVIVAGWWMKRSLAQPMKQ